MYTGVYYFCDLVIFINTDKECLSGLLQEEAFDRSNDNSINYILVFESVVLL